MRTAMLIRRIPGLAFARIVLLTALFTAGGAIAQTAAYPTKPVRVIVPATPGSPVDLLARLLGERFAKLWPQPWVVENRPGAGGTIGADAVARAAPDGYTLLLTANNFIISPGLYPKVPYDVFRDFTPISRVATGLDIVFINASSGVKTLKELAAFARRTPGGVNYGAPFVGSSAHLTMEMLKRAAGIDLNYVPASGGPQAFADALDGRVPVVIGAASAGLPHVKAGRLNALVVIESRRSALAPEVPTVQEAGYPWLGSPFWFALYGPARMPAEIVEQVNRDLRQVLASREIADALLARGYEARPNSPKELETQMREEMPLFAKAIVEAGVKAP
jgi:tripartite-type tricarboxylate transporter receptor subunit TctC